MERREIKKSLLVIVPVAIFVFLILVVATSLDASRIRKNDISLAQYIKDDPNQTNIDNSYQPNNDGQINNDNNNNNDQETFVAPIDRANERVTKKPFGKFVTPEDSPVKPERFRGYHTGTDFEIFEDEVKKDVAIRAVCEGELETKGSTNGYGGYAVQKCQLNGNPITVVYGHLKLNSINFENGESLEKGDIIGILGDEYSDQTDGERKHLHLGFHKGNDVDLRGYVDHESQLSSWIDPCQFVCRNE